VVCGVVARRDIRRANDDGASLLAADPSPSVVVAGPIPNREAGVADGDIGEHIRRDVTCASRGRTSNPLSAPVPIARALADCRPDWLRH